MANRVQVNDLAPPEPIRPAPLQSDTFAAPAPPPMGNPTEQLANALGFFNDKLMAYAKAHRHDGEKAAKEAALADYNHWLASTTNVEQIQAIREGRVRWTADPYIGAVVRHDYGKMEASAIAGSIDADIANGRVPIGDPNWNPEAYVLSKARPTVDRLAVSGEMMEPFRKHLDTVKDSVIKRHQDAMGAAATLAFEDIARRNLDDAVTQGYMQGLRGESLSDAVRQVYKDFGPRIKGGSLDLKYNRLDEIMLEVLERKAKDPQLAASVLPLLYADRSGLDGAHFRMGALATVNKHGDKVDAIAKQAVKTMADEAERGINKQVLAQDVEALKRNDGSFSTIQEFRSTNPVDANRDVIIKQAERHKAAVQAYLQQSRVAVGNGPPDVQRELDVLVKNNIEHPEWIPFLKGAFIAGSTVTGAEGPQAGPSPLERIQQAGQLYNTIADKNLPYLQAHIKDTRTLAFYEMYTALVRDAGLTPPQAAASVSRVFSQKQDSAEVGSEVHRRMADVEAKAKTIGSSWFPWRSAATNSGQLIPEVTKLAKLLVQANEIDPDTAIKVAKKRIEDNAVFVNGRAIFGVPGISQGDERIVQPILDDVFKKNAARLKELGVASGSGLSIAGYRAGVFSVVDAATGVPIMLPVFEDSNDPTRATGLASGVAIKLSDIQALRKAQADRTKAEAVQEVLRNRQPVLPEKVPMIPYDLKRGLPSVYDNK